LFWRAPKMRMRSDMTGLGLGGDRRREILRSVGANAPRAGIPVAAATDLRHAPIAQTLR